MLIVGPLFYSTKYYEYVMRMSFDYPSKACDTSGLRFLKCSYHQVRESAIFRGDSFAPLEPREEPPLEPVFTFNFIMYNFTYKAFLFWSKKKFTVKVTIFCRDRRRTVTFLSNTVPLASLQRL